MTNNRVSEAAERCGTPPLDRCRAVRYTRTMTYGTVRVHKDAVRRPSPSGAVPLTYSVRCGSRYGAVAGDGLAVRSKDAMRFVSFYRIVTCRAVDLYLTRMRYGHSYVPTRYGAVR